MFSPLGLVELGTWVDPWTLLRKTALGRLPSLCPVAAPRFTGCRGYLQCGLELNWAGLAISGSLAHGTGCSSALWCCAALGVATLVLCHFATPWPHTSACVTGLQPLTLVSAHSRHARHWSHHGINGVDCTAPRSPTNRQYSPIRLCPAVSAVCCTHPPLGQLPCAVCAGLFSALCEPTSFLIYPLASHLQRPGSSRYSIPTQLSFPLTLQVDMRVLCVVHLTQDRFPCRSLCRLRVGKAAKVVAPALGSETKVMLRPRRAVRRRLVLWAERDANTKIPQRKDYIISKQNRLNAPGYIARMWAHYNTFRGAPFPR